MTDILKHVEPTDPDLIDRLTKSASQPKTLKQRFAQRVSFVYGNQPKGMNFTREEIENKLRNMD